MKIKICGLKNLEQAQCAADCGADFAGLIFAENSPRKIEISEAEKIAKNLRGKIKLVGVFQNQPTGQSRGCPSRLSGYWHMSSKSFRRTYNVSCTSNSD